MKNPLRRILRISLAVLLLGGLAGCVSYYQPRYGGDGVYYDDGYYTPAATRSRYVVNPVYYPYWSLDYFYFSRHYHPYSVFVGYHDPFYYPYPGWYYGYRPGVRVSLAFDYGWGSYYPWYRYGSHYRHYEPWHFHGHSGHRRLDRHDHWDQPPVRQVDARLREMARRDVARARNSEPVTLRNAARTVRAAERGGEDRRAVARRDGLRTQSADRGSATRLSGAARGSASDAQARQDERSTLRRAARSRSRADSQRNRRPAPSVGTHDRIRSELRSRPESRAGRSSTLRSAPNRAGGADTSNLRGNVRINDRGAGARSDYRRAPAPAIRAERQVPRSRSAPSESLRRDAAPHRAAPERSRRPEPSSRSSMRSTRPATRSSKRSGASRDRGSVRSSRRDRDRD